MSNSELEATYENESVETIPLYKLTKTFLEQHFVNEKKLNITYKDITAVVGKSYKKGAPWAVQLTKGVILGWYNGVKDVTSIHQIIKNAQKVFEEKKDTYEEDFRKKDAQIKKIKEYVDKKKREMGILDIVESCAMLQLCDKNNIASHWAKFRFGIFTEPECTDVRAGQTFIGAPVGIGGNSEGLFVHLDEKFANPLKPTKEELDIFLNEHGYEYALTEQGTLSDYWLQMHEEYIKNHPSIVFTS